MTTGDLNGSLTPFSAPELLHVLHVLLAAKSLSVMSLEDALSWFYFINKERAFVLFCFFTLIPCFTWQKQSTI